MSETFTISKTDGRVTTIHPGRQIDSQAENSTVGSARQACAGVARFILLDLRQVDMSASAGLRALHTLCKMLTPNDEIEAWQMLHAGEVFKSPSGKIAGASPQVHYVLSIAGVLQNIPILPNVQDAPASFDQ